MTVGEVVPPILTREEAEAAACVMPAVALYDSHEALRAELVVVRAERDDNYQHWATRAFDAEARATELEAILTVLIDPVDADAEFDAIDRARAVLAGDP